MTSLAPALLYTGTAILIAAAFQAVRYLRGGDARALTASRGLAGLGALGLAGALAARGCAWGLVPLTTMTDSLALFVMLATVVALAVGRQRNTRTLFAFYMPPLALLSLACAGVASRDLGTPPKALPSVPLVLHVGMAFLAYALFLVASLTSAAYAVQAQRLKRRRTTDPAQRLPSLEQLDATLLRLIGVGYPLFAATLALGLAWVLLDRERLGAYWWRSPKVILACVMVLFYAGVYHGRKGGRLRGPKLAYLFFLGFSLFLTAYLVLGVVNLMNYNFWGPGA